MKSTECHRSPASFSAARSEGWQRAVTIRDWVHDHVQFDYKAARPTKTALDVFTERIGVCRDFQHLAITLTRAMNIPARYVTGYLGDIRCLMEDLAILVHGMRFTWEDDGGPWMPAIMFPDLRRLLVATGRDATDVAITTSFGMANLIHFWVESNEVDASGAIVPLPVPSIGTVNPAIETNQPKTFLL